MIKYSTSTKLIAYLTAVSKAMTSLTEDKVGFRADNGKASGE